MANLSMAKAIIAGKLTADPKLAVTPNGTQVAEFAVAVNSRDAVSYFDCRAFGKTAEFICRYFTKGMSICVDGTLRQDRWAKDGVQRSAVRVVADQVHFVDSKNEAPAEVEDDPGVPLAKLQDAPNFEEIGPDEELPF